MFLFYEEVLSKIPAARSQWNQNISSLSFFVHFFWSTSSIVLSKHSTSETNGHIWGRSSPPGMVMSSVSSVSIIFLRYELESWFGAGRGLERGGQGNCCQLQHGRWKLYKLHDAPLAWKLPGHKLLMFQLVATLLVIRKSINGAMELLLLLPPSKCRSLHSMVFAIIINLWTMKSFGCSLAESAIRGCLPSAPPPARINFSNATTTKK